MDSRPIRQFLVASDLSDRSDLAIDRALALACQHRAPLKILHVVDEDLPASLAASIRDYAQMHLDNRVTASALTTADVDASVDVVFGHDYQAILRVADEDDADIIIVGCHRPADTSGRFLGTVAERVIRHGHRPVLVVKNPTVRDYSKVLVCIDFSVQAQHATRCAGVLAPGARFCFVHAYQIPFQGLMRGQTTRDQVRVAHEQRVHRVVQQQMQGFARDTAAYGADAQRIIEQGPTVEAIMRQIGRIKPDLVVAGTHGRTGVAHMLLGSVAEELLRDPPADMLVVKGW